MIAYFRGKSLVSRAIRWRTWGDYSHVAWIVDKPVMVDDKLIPAGTIYESWHIQAAWDKRNGVRRGYAGDLHKPGTEVDLYTTKLPDEAEIELIRFFERLCADPHARYDFRGVISGFMLRKDTANSKRRWFCSELLMAGFFHVGKQFLLNIRPEQASPVDCSHSPDQQFVGRWETSCKWKDHKLMGYWK